MPLWTWTLKDTQGRQDVSLIREFLIALALDCYIGRAAVHAIHLTSDSWAACSWQVHQVRLALGSLTAETAASTELVIRCLCSGILTGRASTLGLERFTGRTDDDARANPGQIWSLAAFSFSGNRYHYLVVTRTRSTNPTPFDAACFSCDDELETGVERLRASVLLCKGTGAAEIRPIARGRPTMEGPDCSGVVNYKHTI